MKWKQVLVVLTLIASLFIPATLFQATAKEVPAVTDYYLTNSVKVAVKSVLNEQIPEGTRIGAVVRLTNEGPRLTRVPDVEVRAKTEEGIEYKLVSSQANPVAIQPKETVELSYMIVVDRQDAFSLSELTWVDVDEYASPKTEKSILSIPVASLEWRGENAVISNPEAIKQWGETFTISALSTALEYKPVSFNEQNTPKGSQTILELLVDNKTDQKKKIPDFRMNVRSDTRVFNGQRLEKDPIVLEPAEKRYIHYVFPAGSKDALKSLMILTPESFSVDDKTQIDFAIGQLAIMLPADSSQWNKASAAPAYDWNKVIEFDPLNKVIPSQVGVSLVSLQLHEGVGGGFKAAVAKFKLQNRSDNPIALPQFQAQLIDKNGSKYMGVRQTTAVEALVPNISYVIYYTFVMPSTEKGDQLTMEMLDTTSVAPYNLAIAKFQTTIQADKAQDGVLNFYPFQVKVNSWKVEVYMGSMREALPYSYKLILDLDIQLQDGAVVDQSFPKMKAELVDAQGRVIGSKALSFTNENKLVTGSQTISLDSILFEFADTLRLYETVDTPFGQAERLIATIH
ncbi:hypothetical protein CF651_16525 [Paenibacillus rigui]|uniref:Uncharacterized protein n=2 Tax=Paenibacillus rigui TaxID=554312 RepID=A0A229UPA0_9BACL|nr:hypothetical protein CF651_16525 [Paenibacillus rigui]